MNAKRMLLGLLPWLLFSLIVQHAGAHAAGYAALGAALVAVVLMVWPSPMVNALNVTGTATFLILGVIALVDPGTAGDAMADYGRGIAALVLGLVMLGSLPLVPFSEAFVRAAVPEQYWHSPVFRAINRRISAGWGVAVLLISGSFLAYGALAARGHTTTGSRLLLSWIIPAMLGYAAVRWTGRVTGSGRRGTAPDAAGR